MAPRSFRKSQLIAFDNVAAGHDGVLSDPAGTLIIKPCKQDEIDFYESLSAHPAIIPFVPTYLGRLSLGSSVAQAASALVLPGDITIDSVDGASLGATAKLPIVDHAWAPSNGGKIATDHAVVLENLTAGFYKPSILDVKLGARLWADDAPAEKRARLDQAAADTTSGSLGFRIAGMKTYRGLTGHAEPRTTASLTGRPPLERASSIDEYDVFTKDYGRKLTAETIQTGFEAFFGLRSGQKPSYAVRQVINGFIEDLEAIIAALESDSSRMYSASLLFVYEGHHQTLESSISKEFDIIDNLKAQAESAEASITSELFAQSSSIHHLHQGIVVSPGGKSFSHNMKPSPVIVEEHLALPHIQTVKLIDFAHATWTSGQGPDDNLINGITNVIRHLRRLLASK